MRWSERRLTPCRDANAMTLEFANNATLHSFVHGGRSLAGVGRCGRSVAQFPFARLPTRLSLPHDAKRRLLPYDRQRRGCFRGTQPWFRPLGAP